jgi:protein O-GlcNAc transferase
LKRKNKNAARRRNVSKKGSRSAAFDINGKLREATLLHKSGRFAEAEDVYKEILVFVPDHADILNLLGLAVFQKGEYSPAEGFIKKAIRINPSNPLYFINLGNALHGLNKENEAANAYLQALAIHPDHAEALNNLGNVYYVQGKMDESLSCYKRAIKLNENNPDACNNLGIVLRKLGRPDEAVSILRKALKLKPDHALALNSLGMALKEQNRFAEAIGYYHKSLKIQSEPDTYNNLALALQADGRPDEAVSACLEALEVYPENSGIYVVLGGLLKSHGRPEEAMSSYRKALSINPDHAETYNSMGDVLSGQGKTGKAILCFEKALRLKPDDFKIYLNLGNAFKNQGKMSMAVEAYKRVLEIEPGCAPACNNLAGALLRQGKLEEAIKSYQEAVAIQPDYAVAHSNLLFTYNYQNHMDPEWLFSQHRNWAKTHTLSKGGNTGFIPSIGSTDRKIRIGYCSPDFRTHSVAYFLEAIIKAHDRSEFETFCYSDVTRPDEVTRMFSRSVDCFTNVAGIDNTAVAEQIRRDKIHILVDLAGHTAGYRIPLFSIKPAPIQVSYLGYPNTTGLTSMDYRLTDARADPPGLTDHLYSEKLVRLPHTFLCYTPPERSPEIETAANRDSGRIIFGSFNNRAKITPGVVKAWAKILTQVPDGRIILKSRVFADPETRNLLIDFFMENGVERGRIELVSHIPSMFGHLQLYNRIDIGLDTFPYNGTTTTCEALWMGVPVITLAGKTHRSRVGASLLSNVGLEEFIAESVEDYVEKGVSLANDVKKCKSLHRDLRPRMTRSFLMDSARFIRSLEKAYHWMFNEWVESSGILSK